MIDSDGVKISVVLPVYNGEDYIRETIDSIRSQTMDEWELIIVDDCSEDSTPEIAHEYTSIDKRIRYVRNKSNSKTPTSINNGFELARAEILTWVADDNIYYPKAFESMYKYLCEHDDIQFVYTDMDYIDAAGEITRHVSYPEDRMYYNYSAGGCFAFRRSLYDEIGGYDPECFTIEDYEYVLRIMMAGYRLGHIKENHFKFRLYDQSLSSLNFLKMKKLLNSIRIKNIDWFIEGIRNNEKYLVALYLDMLFAGDMPDEIRIKFEKVAPILMRLHAPDMEGRIVVYGAGQFGAKMNELVGNRIAYYVDRDKEKIGKKFHEVDVISPDDVLGLKDDYQVVVAMDSDIAYDVISQYVEKGITNICTFHQFMRLE